MNERKRVKESDADPIYFSAVDVGKSLREVAVDLIQTENDSILSRWYHSEKEADVYLWLDGRKNIIKQQVHLFGQLVEWNILDGIRTGMVIEQEDSSENSVQFDVKPIVNSINQVLAVVSHAENVPEYDRLVLLANFKEGKTLSEIGVDEFVEKFGTHKEDSETSLWEKIRSWIHF